MGHISYNKLAKIVSSLTRDTVLNGFVASKAVPRPLRWRLLRALGLQIQSSAISAGGFYGGTNIFIDHGTFLNYGVFLDNAAQITIGRSCQIGPQVMLLTGTHQIGGPAQRAGRAVGKPVVIGDGVWIGARATILPGVTVGSGCIIAAGAVVIGDCEPNGLYAGVPAERKSELQL
ncbi:acyltransferase [Arthrobacter sp. FX8]|uniref:acyltransferase n=1 Tax=Arthrobacter sp. FX8 TaxID=2997335 RepID=UPI003FA3B157